MYKVLCTELGTPHKTQSYLHYQTKIIIWEWEREREIEKKWTGEIPYTNLCCVFLLCFMLLLLSVPLFFVLFVFSVCVFALFFCICLFFFSFPPSSFFFFFTCACLSLFIKRFQRNCSLLFSPLIRSWSSFCQFFPPQLLISCSAVTHFSAFFSFLCSVTF